MARVALEHEQNTDDVFNHAWKRYVTTHEQTPDLCDGCAFDYDSNRDSKHCPQKVDENVASCDSINSHRPFSVIWVERG